MIKTRLQAVVSGALGGLLVGTFTSYLFYTPSRERDVSLDQFEQKSHAVSSKEIAWEGFSKDEPPFTKEYVEENITQHDTFVTRDTSSVPIHVFINDDLKQTRLLISSFLASHINTEQVMLNLWLSKDDVGSQIWKLLRHSEYENSEKIKLNLRAGDAELFKNKKGLNPFLIKEILKERGGIWIATNSFFLRTFYDVSSKNDPLGISFDSEGIVRVLQATNKEAQKTLDELPTISAKNHSETLQLSPTALHQCVSDARCKTIASVGGPGAQSGEKIVEYLMDCKSGSQNLWNVAFNYKNLSIVNLSLQDNDCSVGEFNELKILRSKLIKISNNFFESRKIEKQPTPVLSFFDDLWLYSQNHKEIYFDEKDVEIYILTLFVLSDPTHFEERQQIRSEWNSQSWHVDNAQMDEAHKTKLLFIISTDSLQAKVLSNLLFEASIFEDIYLVGNSSESRMFLTMSATCENSLRSKYDRPFSFLSEKIEKALIIYFRQNDSRLLAISDNDRIYLSKKNVFHHLSSYFQENKIFDKMMSAQSFISTYPSIENGPFFTPDPYIPRVLLAARDYLPRLLSFTYSLAKIGVHFENVQSCSEQFSKVISSDCSPSEIEMFCSFAFEDRISRRLLRGKPVFHLPSRPSVRLGLKGLIGEAEKESFPNAFSLSGEYFNVKTALQKISGTPLRSFIEDSCSDLEAPDPSLSNTTLSITILNAEEKEDKKCFHKLRLLFNALDHVPAGNSNEQNFFP